ncbi:MAG: o-succinylbenzoate synthase [Timaviella obliquedivisa GSE-PSE-MK23-08B]|jgi:O-succinylbenzoate synthase|nr:o-succinylbenzoate synthase [Timaviella obliquedivisa GSE-PSE-MK23-08B]
MLKVEFRCYQRSFKQPLVTHHGLWKVREGIILRLSDRQQTSWGEIAPLEAFGSESFEQALRLCQSLTEIDQSKISQIPAYLPACRFGFESAWEGLKNHALARRLTYSTLLPTGSAAIQAWRSLWNQGTRTFKWKIGVAPIHQEMAIFEKLVTALPTQTRLRLDANGGLSWEDANLWLQKCDRYGVEFLEQPLPPAQFDAMLQLSHQHQTPIALDESVATIEQLEHCYELGWRGIFVVKAAIAGSPSRLRAFCNNHGIDIVWSSVFETAIAQRYIQDHLIPSLSTQERAIGFGVNHWFDDDLNQLDGEQLWQSL